MGDEFEVKVEDLTKGSHVRVHCICNNCCKDLDWVYKDYIRQVKENGETYCDGCGIRLLGINKIKINISQSHFKRFCLNYSSVVVSSADNVSAFTL